MTTDTPTQVANQPRRRLKPEERRQELLDSAAAMVVTVGVTDMTMEGLAAAAGVNKALLYHYFTNRDGVIIALQQRTWERFRDGVRALIDAQPDPDARLRALVAGWLEPSADGELMNLLAAVSVEGLESARLRQNIEAAVDVAGMVRDVWPMPEHTSLTLAATFMAGSQGFVPAWRLSQWPVDQAVDFFVDMIRGAAEAVATHP